MAPDTPDAPVPGPPEQGDWWIPAPAVAPEAAPPEATPPDDAGPEAASPEVATSDAAPPAGAPQEAVGAPQSEKPQEAPAAEAAAPESSQSLARRVTVLVKAGLLGTACAVVAGAFAVAASQSEEPTQGRLLGASGSTPGPTLTPDPHRSGLNLFDPWAQSTPRPPTAVPTVPAPPVAAQAHPAPAGSPSHAGGTTVHAGPRPSGSSAVHGRSGVAVAAVASKPARKPSGLRTYLGSAPRPPVHPPTAWTHGPAHLPLPLPHLHPIWGHGVVLPPGHGGLPPGHGGLPPGHGIIPPTHGILPPGHGGFPPGHSGFPSMHVIPAPAPVRSPWPSVRPPARGGWPFAVRHSAVRAAVTRPTAWR